MKATTNARVAGVATAAVCAMAISTAEPASAQPTVLPLSGFESDDASLFHPTVDPGPFLSVYDSKTLGRGRFSVGFHGQYAQEPLSGLRRVGGKDDVQSFVEHQGVAHLVGAIGITDRFQLGLEIPGYFGSENDVLVAKRSLGGEKNNLGDILLNAKIDIFRQPGPEGFGIAILPRVNFPTGNKREFAGTGKFGYGGRLVTDYNTGRYSVAANLGGLVRDGFGGRGGGDTLEDLFQFGLAGAAQIAHRQSVVLEAQGVTDAGDPFADAFHTPVEAMIAYRMGTGPVDLTFGAGSGIPDGKRTSTVRVLFGVTSPREEGFTSGSDFSSSQKSYFVEDHDRNGFVSPGDVIVYEILLANTGGDTATDIVISDPVPAFTEFVSGSLAWNDQPVDDSIGYNPGPPATLDVLVPELPATPGLNAGKFSYKVRIRRDIPAPMAVRNEALVSVPGLPEFRLAAGDAEVFPVVTASTQVVPTPERLPERLDLTQRVNFESGSSVLLEDSRSVLRELADYLKTQPQMEIAIIGHTDNQGDEQRNLVLSRQRSESVRDYLVSRGIRRSRMEALGRGEYEPIASNATAAGRETNRRVEFQVLQ